MLSVAFWVGWVYIYLGYMGEILYVAGIVDVLWRMSGIDLGVMRRSRGYRVIYLFAFAYTCSTAAPMIVSGTGRISI